MLASARAMRGESSRMMVMDHVTFVPTVDQLNYTFGGRRAGAGGSGPARC